MKINNQKALHLTLCHLKESEESVTAKSYNIHYFHDYLSTHITHLSLDCFLRLAKFTVILWVVTGFLGRVQSSLIFGMVQAAEI